MSRIAMAFAAAAAFFALSGCGATVNSKYVVEDPALRKVNAPEQVLVLHTGQGPAPRPFKAIGRIFIEFTNGDAEAQLQELKEVAAAHGADAIIVSPAEPGRTRTVFTMYGPIPVDDKTMFSAVAVVWDGEAPAVRSSP